MLRTLYRASPPLAVTGWVHLGLLAAMTAAALFDHRLVTGINPWIKPAKFAISITVFVWTLAWLLRFLPEPHRAVSWGVSGAMFVEIICIGGQAARGVPSHYNDATPFDAAVFAAMAIAIGVNTILVIRVLWLFCRPVPMPSGSLWGVRFGLVLFLLASLEGGVMIGNHGHTVGLADGGPGLPLVNWSTRAGDLRIAHFAGMHALQILPLAGWFFGRRWPRGAVAGVATLFGAWLAAFAILLIQALGGRPLLTV